LRACREQSMFWLLAKAKAQSSGEEEEYRYFAAGTQEIDGVPDYLGSRYVQPGPHRQSLVPRGGCHYTRAGNDSSAWSWWLGSASQETFIRVKNY